MSTVRFIEDTHKYLNGDMEYISSTTLIKKFSEPFDSKYWSTYKAVKDVFSKKNKWDLYKKQCNGWENVVKEWSNNPEHLDEVLDRKNYYLEDWKESGRIARIKGTAEHKRRELEIIGSTNSIQRGAGRKMELSSLASIPDQGIMAGDFTISGVHAEALVWNHKYKVAGQVDKVIQQGRHLDIEDYKTNKKLDTQGFGGKMMKRPLSNLPDCNMSHYMMQLSLYAWMMEQVGYHIGSLTIVHIPNNVEENRIEVEYRPDLVEKMLIHYARTTLK